MRIAADHANYQSFVVGENCIVFFCTIGYSLGKLSVFFVPPKNDISWLLILKWIWVWFLHDSIYNLLILYQKYNTKFLRCMISEIKKRLYYGGHVSLFWSDLMQKKDEKKPLRLPPCCKFLLWFYRVCVLKVCPHFHEAY